jgi:hypothetical protein
MRCNEVQERFIDLLYNEKGTPAASPELQGHINSCLSCRRELQELQTVRRALGEWDEESPARSFPAVARRGVRTPRPGIFCGILRYAAVAVLAILSFLAVSNAEFTSNGQGISLKTHLFKSGSAGGEVYTKAEVRGLLKQVLDETEIRTNQTTYQMIQVMMDTMEQERSQDLLYVKKVVTRGSAAKN